MGLIRSAASAVTVAGLAATVAVVANLATAAGAAGSTAGPASLTARAGATPVIAIQPDLRHVGGVAAGGPQSTAFCERHYKIACYTATQLERAYGLQRLYHRGINGKGQTIVIVDSFGSPTIAHDLAVFDRANHLPAPPSLKIIQPAGRVAPYRPTSDRLGWAGETELDVEYAHAVAPMANILVVETPTSENEGTTGFPQIVRAETYVINHHLASVISQSFSATEETFATARRLLALRGAYQDAAKHGVTVLAASGDSGAADLRYDGSTYYLKPVTSWPDSDPLVTGVGGTQLHLNPVNGAPQAAATVWNDTYNVPTNEYIVGNRGPNPLASGGGKSAIFPRPRYQNGVRAIVGNARGVPDISMSGACNGAVDMYQSFKGQPAGWYPVCGTSEATPEFAGIVALADQVAGHPLGLINPLLYRMSALRAPGIADVLTGNNTVSFRQGKHNSLHRVRGYAALPRYDLASGVGTVYAPLFVRELALLSSHPNWTIAQLNAAVARLS